MSSFEHQGVTLDLCPACKGLWFDRGELAKALGGQPPELGPPASLELESARRHCPRCESGLGERRLKADAGLRVDVCVRCEGLFLERGELERVRRLARHPRHLSREDVQAMREAVPAPLERYRRTAITAGRLAAARPTWLFKRHGWDDGAGMMLLFLLQLPQEEDRPPSNRAWATWALVVLNLLAWAWQLRIGLERSVDLYAMRPTEILAGERLHALVSSMFVHAGWAHLVGNVWFLWLFGDNVEDRLGTLPFLLLYFAAGVGADVLTLISGFAPEARHLGSSGAIAGILGAYMVLFPGARILTSVFNFFFLWVLVIALPAWFYFGGWLLLQGLGVFFAVQGVGWWAHLGGFAVGLAAAAGVRALGIGPSPGGAGARPALR